MLRTLTFSLVFGGLVFGLFRIGDAQAQTYYSTGPYYTQPAPTVVYQQQPQVVYAQPTVTYVQPTYYAQPVYAAPAYYGYAPGYYSPLSLGFYFGGGHHWH